MAELRSLKRVGVMVVMLGGLYCRGGTAGGSDSVKAIGGGSGGSVVMFMIARLKTSS